jgi:thiol-disulfide isomerase/thioredoxin
MNSKILIAFVVILCGYFGYRHMASVNAAKALAQVPVNPGGTGGMDSLEPTRELSNYRQPNRHTVFIFSANWCPGCRSLEGYLPAFLEARKDVAIRHISVDDPATSARVTRAAGVKVQSIPHVVIYDADGNIAATDNGSDKSGLDALVNWINAEINKSHGGTP